MEFEQWFASEEACREYIFQLRWPDGFRCPCCGHEKAWLTSRKLYHCAHCGHETSITAGTIFQDTRQSLCVWFRLIWYMVSQKNGVNALGLQRALGLHRYETTWILLHKLRIAMVRPGRERLSGNVEVDETYIGGKRPGKRGRGAAGKSLVVIAVEDKENHLGRIRLRRVPDASKVSLIQSVQESVKTGSAVRTDDWNGYTGLNSKGYNHIVVRQTANVGENLLPMTHRVAALLKRWLQGTHHGAVRGSHLDYYLDEFTFRFNRRTSRSRGKLFYRLVQQAVKVKPVKGQDIRGGTADP
jgi:transposase-like protein